MTTDPRNETLRDKIATIIQAGTAAKRTSDEIAGDVLSMVREQIATETLIGQLNRTAPL